MESLYILIPIAVLFVAIAVGIFFWAVKSGQFDDLEAEGKRILFDDRQFKASDNNQPNQSDQSVTEKKNR